MMTLKMKPYFILTLLFFSYTSTSITNPTFVWRFSIVETWKTNNKQHSQLQGTADCPPQGCQSLLTINFTLPSRKNRWPNPFLYFLYDQTKYNCKNYWQRLNLGCPYQYCKIHYAYDRDHFFTQNVQSVPYQYQLNIQDPWDP